MCTCHFVQCRKIRNIEQRVAGKFAENTGDLLLAEQSGERRQVLCIAAREELHSGAEFRKNLQRISVGETEHDRAFARTPRGDRLEGGVDGRHAARMEADVCGRRTRPPGEAIAQGLLELRIGGGECACGQPILRGARGEDSSSVLPVGACRRKIRGGEASSPESVDSHRFSLGERGALLCGLFVGKGQHVASGFRFEDRADFLDKRVEKETRVARAQAVHDARFFFFVADDVGPSREADRDGVG